MEKDQENCSLCNGTGITKNIFKKDSSCPVCKGTGKIDSKNNDTKEKAD